ncbi:MAG: glycosyltransferase [Anaerolineae bacterium]|nr:glycosyltransferase [Anaerolineae bacterium]
MSPLRILYDGWPLVHHPNSPAALHLHAILALLPEDIQPILVLPQSAPNWLPKPSETRIHPSPASPKAHLVWQQSTIPSLAKQLDAHLVHLTSPNAPLFANTPIVVSPAGFGHASPSSSGFTRRLRFALGRGGFARASAVLWPQDLPQPLASSGYTNIPPTVHPAYTPAQLDHPPQIPGIDLPDSYCLYHGPSDRASLHNLLQGWSWAAGTIGVYWPLLILGMDEISRSACQSLIAQYQLDQTVRIMPSIAPPHLPALYQYAAALFHPAPVAPWGGPLRRALACALPVVTLESPLINALVGPAAYTVPPGDHRALGAAFIASIINDDLSASLSAAAKKHAAQWQISGFSERLLKIYQSI